MTTAFREFDLFGRPQAVPKALAYDPVRVDYATRYGQGSSLLDVPPANNDEKIMKRSWLLTQLDDLERKKSQLLRWRAEQTRPVAAVLTQCEEIAREYDDSIALLKFELDRLDHGTICKIRTLRYPLPAFQGGCVLLLRNDVLSYGSFQLEPGAYGVLVDDLSKTQGLKGCRFWLTTSPESPTAKLDFADSKITDHFTLKDWQLTLLRVVAEEEQHDWDATFRQDDWEVRLVRHTMPTVICRPENLR